MIYIYIVIQILTFRNNETRYFWVTTPSLTPLRSCKPKRLLQIGWERTAFFCTVFGNHQGWHWTHRVDINMYTGVSYKHILQQLLHFSLACHFPNTFSTGHFRQGASQKRCQRCVRSCQATPFFEHRSYHGDIKIFTKISTGCFIGILMILMDAWDENCIFTY